MSKWPPDYDDRYLPPPGSRYWFPERECQDPEAREGDILRKIQATMAWAWERAPFYRKKWQGAGLEPGDIKGLDDFRKVPVVTKQELRDDEAAHRPLGSYLCIPREEVRRIHGTSGTTGKPTAFAIGRDDWRRIANAHARVMWSFGLRPSDTVFFGSFFSLYMGGWGALAGVERLGATAFPFGAGVPGQTLMALRWLREMRPSAFYGTPSYGLYVAEKARQEGIDPREFGLRILFFSGEPGAGIPSTKRRVEEAYGGMCVDTGSMAEMTPWMTNAECEFRSGMHLWQDIVYTELLHPELRTPMPFGQEGVPTYTHLERTSQPMIRLWSGDLATWTDEVDVKAGKHLVEQGAFPHEFMLIESGTAEVVHDGNRIADLGPGDFFGEMALLEEHRRTATVTASSDLRIVVMHDRDFRAMEDEMPEVAQRIRAVMDERRGRDQRRSAES